MIAHARQLIKEKSISPTKLYSKCVQIAEATNHLNSYTSLNTYNEQSRELDLSSKSTFNRPLAGIPISIKDNFCTKGIKTTCSSKMLENFIPNYDATPVSKLKDAGALVMGKTNMDEFAMGSSSTTSFFGPTANFWPKGDNIKEDADWYMAGGSSTGSAVSVATGSSFASLGTDTGGSTRHPASLVGVVGFKPTYGLISRFGLIPLVHSLDVVSIIARTVADTKEVFHVIRGEDKNDLTSLDNNCIQDSVEKINSLQVVKVGVPFDFITKGNIEADVAKTFESTIKVLIECKSPKFEIVNVDLDYAHVASECYTVISSSEIASNMSCFDGVKYGYKTSLDNVDEFKLEEFYKANRDFGFGNEVKKRVLLGNYFLLKQNRDKYYSHALKVRRLIQDEFDKLFHDNNLNILMMPSTPTSSITHKDWSKKEAMNTLFYEDYFLIPFNLANLPAISLPVRGSNKLEMPVGIQLVANRYHDIDLLYISELFERQIIKNDKSIVRPMIDFL